MDLLQGRSHSPAIISHTALLLLVGLFVCNFPKVDVHLGRWGQGAFTFNILSPIPAASPLDLWTRFPGGANNCFITNLLGAGKH